MTYVMMTMAAVFLSDRPLSSAL